MLTANKTKEFMLSTQDNPFDPFTQFEKWYEFDTSMNYHTLSYLARIARTSNDLSDTDNRLEINNAINEIMRLNVLGIYKRVEAGHFKPLTEDVS